MVSNLEKQQAYKNLLEFLHIINSSSSTFYYNKDERKSKIGAFHIIENQIKQIFENGITEKDWEILSKEEVITDKNGDKKNVSSLKKSFWNTLLEMYTKFPFESKICRDVLNQFLDNGFNPWLETKKEKLSRYDSVEDRNEFRFFPWAMDYKKILNNVINDEINDLTIKLLKLKGAPNLNPQSSWLKTLILGGCKNTQLLNNLLHHFNIDLNDVSDYSSEETLLHETKNWDTVKWLLDHEIDYKKTDAKGKIPSSNWSPDVLEKFNEYRKENNLNSKDDLDIKSIKMDRYWGYICGELIAIDKDKIKEPKEKLDPRTGLRKKQKVKRWYSHNTLDKQTVINKLGLSLNDVYTSGHKKGISLLFLEVFGQKKERSAGLIKKSLENNELNFNAESVKGISDAVWLFFMMDFERQETDMKIYRDIRKLLNNSKSFNKAIDDLDMPKLINTLKNYAKNNKHAMCDYMDRGFIRYVYKHGILNLLRCRNNDDYVNNFFNTKSKKYGSLFWQWMSLFYEAPEIKNINLEAPRESSYSGLGHSDAYLKKQFEGFGKTHLESILPPSDNMLQNIIDKNICFSWEQGIYHRNSHDTSGHELSSGYLNFIFNLDIFNHVKYNMLYNQNYTPKETFARFVLQWIDNFSSKQIKEISQKIKEVVNDDEYYFNDEDKEILNLYKDHCLSQEIKKEINNPNDNYLENKGKIQARRKFKM